MKAGWEVRPLGEVCGFQGGTQPPKSEFVDSQRAGYVRLLQIRDFKSDDKAVFVRDNGKVKKCVATDIMIGRYGASVGQIHRGKAGAYNVALVRTIPDTDILDRDYFYYYLTSDLFQVPLVGKKSRGAQDGFNQEDIDPFPIPLPPLEEQQRIVAVLDEAFEGLTRARVHAEANLQNARELFDASLHFAFYGDNEDWHEQSLSDVGETQTGSTPKTSEPGNEGTFIPFIKPGDFHQDGTLDYYNSGLSEKGASVSRLVPAGSALMVCIGATIGKAGFTDKPVTTNQQINAVVPAKGVSGEYLYYQMLTPAFQAAVIHSSGQATLPIINKSKWSNLKVRLPSIPQKQLEIVERMSTLRAHLDAASQMYRKKLNDIDALRQSLLQKAFAGELT